MKRVIRLVAVSAGIFLVISVGIFAQEKVEKKVKVIHKEVHLRITKEGQPVKGLKKEDVILFINNRERSIQGFNEYSRRIRMDHDAAGEPSSAQSRLFILLFNVADHHLKMKSALDTLFNEILTPQDRIIVFTNNFSIQDRLVGNKKDLRKKLESLMDVEIKKNRQDRFFLENSLKELRHGLLPILDIDDPDGKALNDVVGTYSFIQRSFTIYLHLLRDNRNQYMDMTEREYIRLAEYLKRQKVDKFLISFYQLGSFPRLKPRSIINKKLDELYSFWIVNPDPQKIGSTYASQLQTLRNELEMELEVIGNINEKDVGRHFSGSGATVYAMLLSYKGLSDLDDDFEYGTVGTGTENVLREIAKMAGGKVEITTNSQKFIEQVAETEDVYYLLTYIPEKSDGKQPKLFIRVDDPSMKVLYDNQKRTGYFSEMVEAQSQSPQITIRSFNFQRRTLTFDIDGFRRVEKDGKLLGRFDLRIKIFGARSKLKYDRVKKLVCPTDLLPMKIHFDKLPPGKYDMVVEVKDLLTGKNDLHFQTVHITSQAGQIRRRL